LEVDVLRAIANLACHAIRKRRVDVAHKTVQHTVAGPGPFCDACGQETGSPKKVKPSEPRGIEDFHENPTSDWLEHAGPLGALHRPAFRQAGGGFLSWAGRPPFREAGPLILRFFAEIVELRLVKEWGADFLEFEKVGAGQLLVFGHTLNKEIFHVVFKDSGRSLLAVLVSVVALMDPVHTTQVLPQRGRIVSDNAAPDDFPPLG